MAEVVPFKGIRYNPEIISDMADVVSPPYDVISSREQDAFYRRHPNNIIRLILGKPDPGDDDQCNVHTRACDYLQQWLSSKVLIQDSDPSFYLTIVEFVVGEQKVIRCGLIGLVRLEPFDKGIILPHERTFSKVKTERLKLMKACNANLCPVFGLFSDGSGVMSRLHETISGKSPDMVLVDDKGLKHRLWRLSDQENLARISAVFHQNRIYIADGHHRYETALNYREWLKTRTTGFSSSHPSNYIMMSLSSLEDPGMVILPAHRLLKNISPAAISKMIEQARDYFEIHSMATNQDLSQDLGSLTAALEAQSDRNAIGLIARDPKKLKMLVLKKGIMEQLFGDELPEPLRVLDVSVLTHLILIQLLKFDQSTLDDDTAIIYSTTAKEATQAILEGEADLGFLLNPTKIEQVQKVAEHGLIMPRKSTYFYPKVTSGLVLNLF